MRYLHTMIRISNVEESLKFYCEGLGLKESRRMENEKGRYTLIFLKAPDDNGPEIELTYNWDGDNLGEGPPRDGHMAFVRSPDRISIEILQEGNLEPKEPWASMQNTGSW